MLIALAGLPGTGKSTIGRLLAKRLTAAYIRIDTIEQALRACSTLSAGVVTEGYAIAYQIAGDNLRLGRIVVADSVNPLTQTRDAWVAVATQADVPVLEVEVTCSDSAEHRRRVENRVTDVAGLTLPDWEAVQQRHYEPWNRLHVVVDTAFGTVAASVDAVLLALPA